MLQRIISATLYCISQWIVRVHLYKKLFFLFLFSVALNAFLMRAYACACGERKRKKKEMEGSKLVYQWSSPQNRVMCPWESHLTSAMLQWIAENLQSTPAFFFFLWRELNARQRAAKTVWGGHYWQIAKHARRHAAVKRGFYSSDLIFWLMQKYFLCGLNILKYEGSTNAVSWVSAQAPNITGQSLSILEAWALHLYVYS